jgi:uncharacterized protein YndB with AHSA1/START domain
MIVKNTPDHPLDDVSCKAATGKSYADWFALLDSVDALKKGRRESVHVLYNTMGNNNNVDGWWATTIYVAYEAHKGIVKKDGHAEGYTICVTKSIGAPVSKTYGVWTSAQGFAELFGDGGTQELVEGGSIRCKGGCKGAFKRIRPDKDLRFTWEHPGCTMPMVVDVTFEDNKGKTMMNVMTSRIQTRGEADGLRDAWAGALAKLKVLAET